MSQCDAKVVAVAGNQVWVEVPGRAPACGSCKSSDDCQTGLLGLSAGPRRYRLENQVGARIGDRVSLEVADGTVWRASLASYVLPLLLAIAGAAVGQSAAGDAWAAAGMLAGLACGWVLLRRRELDARCDRNPFSLQLQSKEVVFKDQS
jgi:sigma-E factor negative regulatory protein RseC